MSIDRIQWLNDLIFLEIELWDRIDARLKADHDLSFASFTVLHAVEQSPSGSLRVGDLARILHVTVGGMSKVVDRTERAGLIRREQDADDRRASRVALTEQGSATLAAASTTCDNEVASVLNASLDGEEQQQFHAFLTRLLTVTNREHSSA